MTILTKSGQSYRRRLPHFRAPGAIYHVRMRIDLRFGLLKTDRDFKIIEGSILFMHKRKCILIAYVIMPDHSHIVLQPRPRANTLRSWCDYTEFNRLEEILGSIKKYTSKEINRIHGRTGKPLWQEESFDRIVRTEKDLDSLVDYIHGNPVRWRLVERPEEYRWSSANTIYSGAAEYWAWFEEEPLIL
jgi:putative transposase